MSSFFNADVWQVHRWRPNWSVGCRWLTGAHLFVGCGGWLAPGSLWQVADRLWSVSLCVHVVRALLFAFFVAPTLSLRISHAQMNLDARQRLAPLGDAEEQVSQDLWSLCALLFLQRRERPCQRCRLWPPCLPHHGSRPHLRRRRRESCRAAGKNITINGRHKKDFTKKVWNTSNAAFMRDAALPSHRSH